MYLRVGADQDHSGHSPPSPLLPDLPQVSNGTCLPLRCCPLASATQSLIPSLMIVCSVPQIPRVLQRLPPSPQQPGCQQPQRAPVVIRRLLQAGDLRRKVLDHVGVPPPPGWRPIVDSFCSLSSPFSVVLAFPSQPLPIARDLRSSQEPAEPLVLPDPADPRSVRDISLIWKPWFVHWVLAFGRPPERVEPYPLPFGIADMDKLQNE